MANILLVDDSVSMREMVSFTLKQQGHDVVEAAPPEMERVMELWAALLLADVRAQKELLTMVMGDAGVVYLGEGFAGDELRIEVAGGEPSRSGFRLFYRITRQPDGEPIALVETGMACFDYELKRIAPRPDTGREGRGTGRIPGRSRCPGPPARRSA